MRSPKKKISAVVLALCLSIPLFSAHPLEARAAGLDYSKNLIQNGGFENGMTGWTDPDGAWGNDDDSCLPSHSGRHYAWPYEKGKSETKIYQFIELDGDCDGLPLSFSIYVGGDPDTGLEKSYAILEFYSEDGKLLYEFSKEHIGAPWEQISVQMKVPANTKRICVTCKGVRRSGSLCDSYFDDAELYIARKTFEVNGMRFLITKEADGSGEGGECSIDLARQGSVEGADLNKATNPSDNKTYQITGIRAKAFKNYDFSSISTDEDFTMQFMNVKDIGAEAFKDAKGLRVVWLNAENIGKEAFSGCSGIKSLYLGTRTRTIGEKAFFNASAMKKIEVKGAIERADHAAFKGITSKCDIKVRISDDDLFAKVKNLIRRAGANGKFSR